MKQSVPASNYYYPNRIGRIYLESLSSVMGENGLHALLNHVNLPGFIDRPPADDLERAFDFADFANLNQGLYEIYGPRGGRNIALRSGREGFSRGLKTFGPLLGVGELTFRVLPLNAKVSIGLPMLARLFTQFSDQLTRVESSSDYFHYYIDRCPVCWGRESQSPVCHVAVGVLQEALTWVSGGEAFRVEEIECIAAGAETCVFRIDRQPVR